MDRGTSANRLRCKPGDTAKVIFSPNEALVGRTVEVVQLHCDGRWECVLVGEAVIGLADDGLGLLLTRDWLFQDSFLEPKRIKYEMPLAALTEALAS